MSGDFRVGAWLVRPSLNAISKNGTDVQVEPKVMEVLVCLATRPGESISKEIIIKTVWPDTFVSDDALIRCVSELRKAFGDNAGKPTVIETIPKRGYRLLIPAVPITPANRLESNLIPEFVDSIAVLPFENSGSDPEMEYLSHGIVETITSNLSRLQDLRVVPRSTTLRMKDKFPDPAELESALGARLVLTGHVAQQGYRLLVGAELIDTIQHAQLWKKTYDRKPEDIFSIQDEIAAGILNCLQLRPTNAEKRQITRRSTESREAYQFYLRAHYFANKWSAEGFRKGFEYCAQAIEADPAYAEAYACLAYLYLLLGLFGAAPPAEAFAKSKAAAIRALEIDEGSADAHSALGFVHLVYDWDLQRSEAESRRAIQLAPNFEASHLVYSHCCLARQQFHEAVAEAKLALVIDPLSVRATYQLASIYYFSGRYDDAIEQLRKANELDSRSARTHQVLAYAYARKGKCQEALAEAEEGLMLSGGSLQGKGLWGGVHALVGRQGDARKVLEELEAACVPPHFFEAYSCAAIHAILGDHDHAIEWLHNACKGHSAAIVFMGLDPNLESLHGNHRFDVLVRQIGLAL
jgi:TolB-like protein/Flp pilus assembly protein TadD